MSNSKAVSRHSVKAHHMVAEYIGRSTNTNDMWSECLTMCPHCYSDDHCYIHEDGKSLFCLQCNKEFGLDDIKGDVDFLEITADNVEGATVDTHLSPEFAAAKAAADKAVDNGKNVSEMKLPGVGTLKEVNTSTATIDWSNWKKCDHPPQHIIAGEGWGVWAGKRIDVQKQAHHFDIALNLTGSSIRNPHVIPIPELKEWESYHTDYKEVVLSWPDYGIVGFPVKFWTDLLTYIQVNKQRVIVFCEGGHGRTGTAVATLMSLSLGYPSDVAIAWVRKHYCYEAVEMTEQENYVQRIAKEAGIE